ncbi:type VI secretion system ImpA family N-terminal domain-containing protein [Burkholderia dolosa]|uniref:type VI secretion system protein TssA n=1 Tax=Burkholderia dolosa TaxID=152500 RepID=UPI001B8F669C|nr:type VI secretion system ImpA family N-terminal domain-containing protein [Burkholderia dolosa]MBR8315953.1 type VI secretion system ImpA family N-terminal domain-containing protein [Burkholderia dolosa]
MNAHAPGALLRYADLLEPVSADAPCGPDLEYDPAFVMLHAAVAPRTDAQYGDFVDAPPQANWAEAERDCRALLLRTKDIRLLTILIRCRIRQSGAEGLRDGVALLLQMLARYGEALHPMPTIDGERDPLVYSNAIAALADADATLADARDIRLPKTAGLQLQLRDIEKAFAVPRAKDALAPESASRLLSELWNRRDPVIVALADAQRAVVEIATWTRDALQNDAPDLDGIVKLLRPFAPAALDAGCAPVAAGSSDTRPQPSSAAEAVECASADTAPHERHEPARAPHVARPADRWSALAAIRETRLWFEQNEPSSPVIVLLRQSERMVGKRFSELANVIPAELLAQWDAIDI